MPRIPDPLIARIKREVEVRSLVEASGVELARKGKEHVGLCPLHPDSEPSLFVNPEKGSWHCFGCERGGSVIDWVMESRGVGFREAAEALIAEHFGDVELAGSSSPPPPVPEEIEPLADDVLDELIEATDRATMRWVADLYHERAGSEEKPAEYLASRGLDHPGLVEHFHLGYSDRTLGLLLPSKRTKRGAAIREKLQRLGIYRETGHEHLVGRLVVPLWSLEGEIVQLYGRAVTPNLRSGTPDHLYLPGERDGVINAAAFVASDELVLTEAPIDAMTFWSAGFSNVTSCFGTNGFTETLHEALRMHGTRRVLVAYDHDERGEAAAKSLAERLLADGIECYRVRFPKGMDANEYAQSLAPAAKSLDLVLRNAEWMGTGPPPADRWSVAGDQGSVPPSGPGEEPAAAQTASFSAASSDDPAAAAADERAAEEKAGVPSAGSAVSSVAAETASGKSPDNLAPAARSGTGSGTGPAASLGTLLPAGPPPQVPVEVSEHEVVITLGDRRYRVRGLAKNLSYDTLRVNLLAARGEGFHVDTLDLYSDRQRKAFVKQAVRELGVEERIAKHDVGRVLLKLEELQDEQIRRALEPEVTEVSMTSAERAEAEELLASPGLVEAILSDFEACGVVGEETNKLLAYLAAVSRKLERPLAVLVQSSSAAGKSALMDAVLAFVPEEERVSYSAMTGQSLFYMGEKDLSHKVLAIAEEEGAERAAYALKLLQSEGELSIASTGKDPQTGRLTTHEYHVEGPVAILFTTTAIDLDDELLNRCLVLTVDETREQTRAIHRMQRRRETLEGQLAARRRTAIRTRHRNAQRLLEPLMVVNPYAAELSFPDACTRMRRDHEKYLSLIRAVTLLHQKQRPRRVKVEAGREVPFVEVTLDDVALANRLAHEVLGRTLDELPPQTRRLLHELEELVASESERLGLDEKDFRFTRRWLRERTRWGDTQLKVHLARLVDLEYLVVHTGAAHAQRYLYELVYDGSGTDGEAFVPGLIDVAALEAASGPGSEVPGGAGESAPTTHNRSGPIDNRSGPKPDRSAPGRPPVGGWSEGGRSGGSPIESGVSIEGRPVSSQNVHPGPSGNASSYPQTARTRSWEADPVEEPEPVVAGGTGADEKAGS